MRGGGAEERGEKGETWDEREGKQKNGGRRVDASGARAHKNRIRSGPE